MIKQFISLELKSFFKSSSVGKSIALKLFLGFLAIYFSLAFLGFGILLYEILYDAFPSENPFYKVQNYIAVWIVAELVFRFFMQTLPVINMKSFLTQNVTKKIIVHYVLAKSVFSFYNILVLLIAVPFTIIAYSKNTISILEGFTWLLSIIIITLLINYTNFLIKKSFTAHLKLFLPLIFVVALLIGLEYFNVFISSRYIAKGMIFVFQNPILILVFLAVLVLVYVLNYKFLKSNFYLDSFLKTKDNAAETTDLSWTKRFGAIAPFLQLDLKLIWRNKRPRATVLMSILFLAYGLIFYNNPSYENMPAFFVFVGIFITGIFIINFGQFIPAWDSGYFRLIHSQNIPLRNYLQSKVALLSFSAIVLGLLSIPYVYFGWHILWINLACALYNIGVNVLLIIYAGSFNKKKIDLEKSPFMNYQGTGAAQWIVGFPLLLIPIGIWYLVYKFSNQDVATIFLALFGILALILRPFFIKKIVLGYQKRKYDTLQGFKQQEN